jgi:hypothetical protein
MQQLPTCEYFREASCLFDDPQLLPVRDVARNAVLSAAKFVVRLSSSIGIYGLLFLAYAYGEASLWISVEISCGERKLKKNIGLLLLCLWGLAYEI